MEQLFGFDESCNYSATKKLWKKHTKLARTTKQLGRDDLEHILSYNYYTTSTSFIHPLDILSHIDCLNSLTVFCASTPFNPDICSTILSHVAFGSFFMRCIISCIK